jgi:predicted trehalose synthase
MTRSGTEVRAVSAAVRAELPELVATFLARRAAPGAAGAEAVDVLDAEVVIPAHPGVIDVVARVGGLDGRLVHVPLGVRASLEEVRFLPDGDEPLLGTLTDDDGPALAFEATRDPELSALLVEQVSGERLDAALVRPLHEDRGSITLAMEDRVAFTAFHDVVDGPRPEIELLQALDDAGFNHLAAPLAVWRRAGRDLGLVQEFLAGASSGHALALTSVRDLYASGGPPELAGGDFGAEAHRLGTMTARMHLGLDKAFGRRPGHVGSWADDIEAVLRPRTPHLLERPDVEEVLSQLRALQVPSQAIRTHGDFHLGRTCRTEQGWYVVDFSNGGRPVSPAGVVPEADAAAAEPAPLAFRSPLADVADMLWSLAHVAKAAADERDPSGRDGLVELADAWVARNRRALLAGYLGVPGISGLVPPGRDALRVVTQCFELVRRALHETPGA